jgi:predicted lipoprotein with Yx(FWY)xxD motif
MTLKILALAGATLAFAAVAAGCGSGGGSTSAAPATTAGGTNASGGGGGYGSGGYGSGGGANTSSSSSAITLKTAMSPLGTILVDQDGKTVYLFEADSMNKSNCSGSCLSLWPPVMANGKASAGSGVSAGMIGTATGSSQVTYAGHPLYWFSGDSKAGDTNGEGLTDFGGAWYAVSPAGKAVKSA